ncbi:MAG: DUF3307 domain-containing protein [Alphaproteobacteria bacterium]|nr:DUF3307 domain-containing protein [Alphaproteobacteria bacterium]
MTLLSFLLIKHFICDFMLQRRYQYENKGKYGHPGGLLHAGIHVVGTAIVLCWFIDPILALKLALLDGVVHYHIDFAKSNVNRKMELQIQHNQYWALLGFDQLLHQLTYIGIICAITNGWIAS